VALGERLEDEEGGVGEGGHTCEST